MNKERLGARLAPSPACKKKLKKMPDMGAGISRKNKKRPGSRLAPDLVCKQGLKKMPHNFSYGI